MERLGPYLLDGELGRGGMGVVWRARDARTGVPVALKTMAVAELAGSPGALERFRREARAATRVVHPNIAGVLDVGDDRGTAYIAFELVAGSSLDRHLRTRGRSPWREVARLGAQVARALAAVHAAGLIHRDVKPANILLAPDGTAKLADFGLVRAVGSKDSLAGTLTQDGAMVGTPQYLAPEQLESRGAIGPAADLYALGGTLYALLVGEPPFAGTTLELMRKHLLVAAPAPSEKVKEVPPALDELVARLLSKDPKSRGGSAAAVAAELEAIAAGERIARRGPGRALLAGGGAALLGAVALVAVVAGRSPHAEPPAPAPVAPVPSAAPLGERPRPPHMTPAGSFAADAAWRHADPIDCVALAPGGEIAVTAAGTHEHSLRAWRVKTLAELWTVKVSDEEGGAAFAVAVSSDRVLAGSLDGSLRLFDLADGHLVAELQGRQPSQMVGVAFVEGGRALSAEGDGTLRLWDLERRSAIKEAKTRDRILSFATATKPGPRLATGEVGERIEFWSPDLENTGYVLCGQLPYALAFSPDGDKLVAGGNDGHLSVFWMLTNETAADPNAEKSLGPTHALAFRPDGLLVDGRDDGGVYLWKVPANTASVRICGTNLADHVSGLAVLPDGDVLASTWGRRVYRLDREKLEPRGKNGGPQIEARSACEALVPLSDEVVAAACGGEDLLVVNVRTGALLERRKGHAKTVISVASSGGRVFSGDREGVVLGWSPAGQRVTIAPPAWGSIMLAPAPDGRRLASLTWDGQVRLLSPEGGVAAVRSLAALGATSVAWDPEGARLIVATAKDKTAAFVGSVDGDEPPVVLDLPSDVPLGKEWRSFASFSPDGRSVVGAALHGPVMLFDAKTWEPARWLERRWVIAHAWLDARHVALGDAFGRIELYTLGETTPYDAVTIDEASFDHVVSLAVRGRWLFVGTARGAVRRFELPRTP